MVTKLEARGKDIFQWGEKFVDVTTLEKLAYQVGLAVARNLMAGCMEQADKTLFEQRDRKVFRDKGYRSTTLKTIMGEVEYRRHVYMVAEGADVPSATVYLLDRGMGLDKVGQFSDTVCMMAVEAACAVSYRTAATELNDLTGLCLLYTSPSPRDLSTSRMPSSA